MFDMIKMRTGMKTILFVAFILLCSFVSSCGSSSQQTAHEQMTEADPAEADTTTEDIEPDLPDLDLNGKEYLFLVHGEDFDYNDKWIDTEAMDGEIVNDAIYERNRAAEEKFDCVISAQYETAVNSYVAKTVMAGDTHFFAVWGMRNDMSSGIQKHVYLDLNQLKHCDFRAAYWDKNCVEQFMLGGRLYMMASDISMGNLDTGPRYLYFNKKIIEDYQLKSPYDYVSEDDWTLDNFLPLVEAVSEDLNGDGRMDREDRFGMLTEDGSANGNILYLLVGAGIRPVSSDESGMPVISIYSEKAQTIIDKVAAVLKSPDKCIEYNVCAKGADYSQFNHLFDYCRSLFASGHFLFVQNGCDATLQFIDMQDDYGIVPNPKYDSAQENYYHRTDPFSTMLAVPATNNDLENSGALLEWMSWKSSRTVLPAYYETTMKLKRQRDDTAMKMLDLIKGSIYYDIADIFDLGVSSVIWDAYEKGDLASIYAKNESKMQKNIDKLIENLAGQ